MDGRAEQVDGQAELMAAHARGGHVPLPPDVVADGFVDEAEQAILGEDFDEDVCEDVDLFVDPPDNDENDWEELVAVLHNGQKKIGSARDLPSGAVTPAIDPLLIPAVPGWSRVGK